MAKKKKVRFVRIRGRIVPISIKREIRSTREILSRKNVFDLAIVGSSAALAGGLLFGSGKAQRVSNIAHKKIRKRGISKSVRRGFSVRSFRFNKLAKLAKFSAAGVITAFAGAAINRIDRRTRNDESAQITRLGGGKTSTGANIIKLGLAIVGFRAAKRLEVAGRRGLNLFKLSDLRKLKTVRDV